MIQSGFVSKPALTLIHSTNTVPSNFFGSFGRYTTKRVLYGAVPAGFTLHSDIVCDYIVAYGSEEQKQQWLPRFVSGETITAIAMTEPGTGSDLQAIRTSAKKDGNHYVVNGSKTYITNGQNADLILVVAKTDPDAKPAYKGMSIILIESDREGFKRGRKLDKIGSSPAKRAWTSERFLMDDHGAGAGRSRRFSACVARRIQGDLA